ncbi:MAG: hypothetical protein U0840_02130 [Gemmataceae bacterium]
MLTTLPDAEVIRQCIDPAFDSKMPVLALRWPDMRPHTEGTWELPGGMIIQGGLPRRFALALQPTSDQRFQVRLLWDHTQMSWPAATRQELLASCLNPLLAALGRDLWSMLDQPFASVRVWPRAA